MTFLTVLFVLGGAFLFCRSIAQDCVEAHEARYHQKEL